MNIERLWVIAKSSSDVGSMARWLERINVTQIRDARFEIDIRDYAEETFDKAEMDPALRNPRHFVWSFANEYGLNLPE